MPDRTNASYSLTIRLSIERKPGMLGHITTAIGQRGDLMGAPDLGFVRSVFDSADYSLVERELESDSSKPIGFFSNPLFGRESTIPCRRS